jgi:Rrf2 family protein
MKKAIRSLKPTRSSLFSAKTEYACVTLLELALHHGNPNPFPLKSVAEKHGISHRFLVQIVMQLKNAGLVESTRGASGGYRLSRPPEAITLADIVAIVDPPEPKKCHGDESALTRTLYDLWDELHLAQQEILANTTLASLVLRAQREYEIVYEI